MKRRYSFWECFAYLYFYPTLFIIAIVLLQKLLTEF